MLEYSEEILFLKDKKGMSFEQIAKQFQEKGYVSPTQKIETVAKRIKTCYFLSRGKDSVKQKEDLIQYEIIEAVKKGGNPIEIVDRLRQYGLIEEEMDYKQAVLFVQKIYQEYRKRQEERKQAKQKGKQDYRQSDKAIGNAFKQGETIQEIQEKLKQYGILNSKQEILDKLWLFYQTRTTLKLSKEEIALKNGMMNGNILVEIAEEFGFQLERLERLNQKIREKVCQKGEEDREDLLALLKCIEYKRDEMSRRVANWFQKWTPFVKGSTFFTEGMENFQENALKKPQKITYFFSRFISKKQIKLEENQKNKLHSFRAKLGNHIDIYLKEIVRRRERKAQMLQKPSYLDSGYESDDGR